MNPADTFLYLHPNNLTISKPSSESKKKKISPTTNAKSMQQKIRNHRSTDIIKMKAFI